MKICTNCSKEYDDIVAYCIECGCALETKKEVSADAPSGTPCCAESKLSALIFFISNIITIISSFFAAVAVALPYVRVSVNISSYTYKIYASASVHPEEACAILALIFAVIALIVTIVSVVLTVNQHLGYEKNFSRITKLFLNVVLVIFAIVLAANI